MKINFHRKQSGFTLIELLVVIGILTILLAIVLIAINPARQFAQSRDTTRKSDVNAILNAVHAYMADNTATGNAPGGIDATVRVIADATSVPTGANICSALVPTYMAAMPKDPSTGTQSGAVTNGCYATYNTRYEISQTTGGATGSGRVTVTAPDTEIATPDISVSR